jgi:hypothetical protein
MPLIAAVMIYVMFMRTHLLKTVCRHSINLIERDSAGLLPLAFVDLLQLCGRGVLLCC